MSNHSAQRWGEGQAERYIRDIWNAFERIAENPKRGRACRGFHTGYWQMLVGSHVIIYRMVGEDVGIVRVLHQAMDIPRHLTPPPRP
ncbi:MAG: type II toxin-antitoxin system RelE/ParE family toxin [Alphaproteobacteria bacterium]|nr:type II toxin-antitoxin system RelE/ParE family toxin [Alphaproteobacteria bacterium]